MTQPLAPRVREAVLKLLEERGPLTAHDLYLNIDLVDGSRQPIFDALNVLHKAGRVRKLGDGTHRWEILPARTGRDDCPSQPRRQTSAARKPAKPARPTDGVAKPPENRQVTDRPPEHAEQIHRILQTAAADTQYAIDAYVASLADPKILGPLRAARDQARAALEAFEASRR